MSEKESTDSVIDRILKRGERASALGADDNHFQNEFDGDQQEVADRAALRRVKGLSTELEDITEVEYRQLRMERVLLIGLWGQNTLLDAENSPTWRGLATLR